MSYKQPKNKGLTPPRFPPKGAIAALIEQAYRTIEQKRGSAKKRNC